MKPYEDRCPECDGEGAVICDCCDSEKECDVCDGEGIDPAVVDYKRFREAATLLFRGNSPDGEWELIENKVWVGRTNGKANIYYRDFRCALLNRIEGEDMKEPKDISCEAWREYDFGTRVYRIDSPVKIYLGETTHRIVDKAGTVHCVPAPGFHNCVLRWLPKDLSDPVKF